MNRFFVRLFAWVQIMAQLFFLLPSQSLWAGTATSPFSVDRQEHEVQKKSEEKTPSPFTMDSISTYENKGNDVSLPYDSELSRAAQMLSSGHTADSASSLAVGQAAGALQGWLGQFGTARIQLNVDRHGNWGHSSADLLVPLYDNQQSLMFIQTGIRKPNDRLTGNLGYGVRTFWQNGWMYGGNVFFDDDFTGKNRRVGVGAEAWTDYLRLSANTYVATTKWHSSRDFDGSWQEKPASGYDIRAEGWLPAYPQLGAKLIWEQYYGQQVALFDKDHLQRNPHAVTTGFEYTPIPLVTLGVDQRQGRGQHDTQFALGIHWSFGHDWGWQTDADNVDALRTLAGNHYELVNRNNEIVMQYRKSPQTGVAHLTMMLVTDNSPADGVASNVVQVLATNSNGEPVPNAPLSWEIPSSKEVQLVGTAVTDNNGLASATLTSSKVQTVPVVAKSGNISASQNSHFTPVMVSHITLSIIHDNAIADGSTENVVVATLTDNNNRPVTGQKVNWKVPEEVSVKGGDAVSDTEGKVTARLTSTAAGSISIAASAGNQIANGTVRFTGNPASAQIRILTVTTDGSPADGKTANVARVTVTDANGNALAGQAVSWKSDKPIVKFGKSAVTNADGVTQVTYTDTLAETLTLTATLSNGNSASQPSRFIPDNNAARLDMTVTSGAKADGSASNSATATVVDGSGNPLANTAVKFSVTGSAILNATTVNTDSKGIAHVTFTDRKVETVQVTAKLASGSSITKDSSFVTDIDSATLTLTATNGALADGKVTNTATVTLKDRDNNPISGQAITLSASGNAKLSATSGTTDSQGQIVVTLTDTTAETTTVTASVNSNKQASTTSEFITFSVKLLTASADSVQADGTTSTTLTATVQDSTGKALANAEVAFSVTGSAKLDTTTATTDSHGQAQALLTDAIGESVTVTARAKANAADTGKTKVIEFTSSRITAVGVFGTSHTFAADAGFPTTGYDGAKMYFIVDGSTDNSMNYTWTSDQPWVTTEGIEATMSGTATPPAASRKVTITGTPKNGGEVLTYTFTLEKWYRKSEKTHINQEESTVVSGCLRVSGTPPYEAEITDGAVSAVGKLFGEWRDGPVISNSIFFFDMDSVEAWRNHSEEIPFIYKDGSLGSSGAPGSTSVMCRANDE